MLPHVPGHGYGPASTPDCPRPRSDSLAPPGGDEGPSIAIEKEEEHMTFLKKEPARGRSRSVFPLVDAGKAVKGEEGEELRR